MIIRKVRIPSVDTKNRKIERHFRLGKDTNIKCTGSSLYLGPVTKKPRSLTAFEMTCLVCLGKGRKSLWQTCASKEEIIILGKQAR